MLSKCWGGGGGTCPLVNINNSTNDITTNIYICTEPNIVNIPDTLDFIESEDFLWYKGSARKCHV